MYTERATRSWRARSGICRSSKVLVDLVVELFHQVEELETRLDELYRSCEEEKWF